MLTRYLIEEFASGVPYRKTLFRMLQDMAVQSAGNEEVSIPLVRAVAFDMNIHLCGPEWVQMGSEDKSGLKKSMKILDTLGYYGVCLVKNSRLLEKVCQGIKDIVEISAQYEYEPVQTEAIKILRRFNSSLSELGPDWRNGEFGRSKARAIQRTLRQLAKPD